MADDLLGSVLGGEDEQPETEAPQALAGAEAFAAAIAAIASRQDPEVARRTTEFLSDQSRLLRTQAQHLQDEHALRLEHLAHQRHLLRGQRLSQAIRIAFQIGIALVILVIGAGIAVMLHDAFASHSVVIDSFEAPAELAPRGVTGTVVASDLLNELTRLQSATHAIELPQKRTLSNGWSNDVKVDVPETGVSLGEVSRLLKARFGHDLHIGGSLVETESAGLALTVSGDKIAPRTFSGGAADLDTLVVDAARYVYSQFQPAVWAVHLENAGRCPEAIAFIKSVYTEVGGLDRAMLLNAWANCVQEVDPSLASWHTALQMYRKAIETDPDYMAPHVNEATGLARSGDEEGAWRLMKATILAIALLHVRLHDPVAAELTLQTVAASDNRIDTATLHFIRGELAFEFGDRTLAAEEIEANEAAQTDATRRALAASMLSMLDGIDDDSCQIALIEELAGHSEKADSILADRATAHFVDCQRFRGDILDHRGDWTGAQQAYAQAVALAPDLPAGYYSWGVALARHGDLASAIAKLGAANQHGPHWADPLKAWGDVLARQGHRSDAIAKYDEALRYAPNWSSLKQARDAAGSAHHG
jgi:tetratricopeptide (TPR) repeat protein